MNKIKVLKLIAIKNKFGVTPKQIMNAGQKGSTYHQELPPSSQNNRQKDTRQQGTTDKNQENQKI